MILIFAESGPIRYFVRPVPLKDGNEEAKGKKSIHFKGGEENIELILRTIISANQRSVYRAVADLCKELSKYSRASGKLVAKLRPFFFLEQLSEDQKFS